MQIDTNNDSAADYVLEVTREKGLDYPLVKVWSISGNASTVVARYPLNSAWGDTDTNIMDTNTMILGVPLKDLGLTAEKAQSIKYTVQTDTCTTMATPTWTPPRLSSTPPSTPVFGSPVRSRVCPACSWIVTAVS